METKKPKCSSDKELDAIVYCGECKIYMCSKCEQFHSKLLSAHQTMNLDKEDGEIFTGTLFQRLLDYYFQLSIKGIHI